MCRAEAAACPPFLFPLSALLWEGVGWGGGLETAPLASSPQTLSLHFCNNGTAGTWCGLTICDPCFPAVDGSLGQEELEDLWHQVSDCPSLHADFVLPFCQYWVSHSWRPGESTACPSSRHKDSTAGSCLLPPDGCVSLGPLPALAVSSPFPTCRYLPRSMAVACSFHIPAGTRAAVFGGQGIPLGDRSSLSLCDPCGGV